MNSTHIRCSMKGGAALLVLKQQIIIAKKNVCSFYNFNTAF